MLPKPEREERRPHASPERLPSADFNALSFHLAALPDVLHGPRFLCIRELISETSAGITAGPLQYGLLGLSGSQATAWGRDVLRQKIGSSTQCTAQQELLKQLYL